MAAKVFLAYTFRDEAARNELINRLYRLRWRGLVGDWEERAVGQGSAGSGEISPFLEHARLILLLISPDFVHATYCYSSEVKYALQRHEAGQTRILPILVRPTELEDTPLAGLPVLPANGTAISAWPDRDAAWEDVVRGLELLLTGSEPLAWQEQQRPWTAEETPPTAVWQVPYRRNSLFTGREAVLRYLHDVPISNKASAITPPQVIAGPAGSGKTQIALEYAYRYGHEYEAVLWVNAASRQLLIHDFARIAEQLGLAESTMPNQRLIALAVRRHLETSPGWLLIIDNITDMEVVEELLPRGARGHMILLSRQQSESPAMLPISLKRLEPAEAMLLLLRRAGLLMPEMPLDAVAPAELARAAELVEALQVLPLALALAGAYIDGEQCSLNSYLSLYQQAQIELQKQAWFARNRLPEAAAAVLLASLKRAERLNPRAIELLRLCSFLQPDAIPLALLISGSSELEEELGRLLRERFELLKLIHDLRRFALIEYSQESLSLHRLVGLVVEQAMSRESRHLWAEQTIRLVESAVTSETAPPETLYRTYLPHLLTCARRIEEGQIETPAAARLLEQTGYYLQRCLAHQEAEPLLRRALALREQLLGPAHPELAPGLYNLALFYEEQGRCQEAEALYRRLAAIEEQQPGATLQGPAQAWYHLALLYRDRRDFARAEPLFLRVLEIWKRERGPEHATVATLLMELAALYRAQGRYAQAGQLYRQALAMRERMFGPEHLAVGQVLSALGSLYHAQRQYSEAEDCYLRALAINEQAPLPEQLDLATTLNNLALLYRDTGRHAQAELLYQRALAIYRQLVGDEHPYTASCLENLAMLYHDRGEYERAEPLYQSALQIRERTLGHEHPALAVNLNNLATLYTAMHKYGQARSLFKRALEMGERTFGKQHPIYARFLENYAQLLQQTRQTSRAVELKAQAREIQARYAQGF
jgi:tetratricopeptide (TPR) repeat protein